MIKNKKVCGKGLMGLLPFNVTKALIVLTFMLTSFIANATHIVGGHIDWRWISGKTYEIKVVFYRDCNGVQFQDPLYIGIYDRGTNLNTGYNIQMPMTSRQVLTLGDACFTPGVCVEEAVYVAQLDFTPLGNTPNGLYFAMDVCCRNSAVQNIANPLNTGMTFYTEVPDLDPASPNHDKSVPLFGSYPKAYMCVNQINTLNFGATDLDGDSLVYSLVTPYNSSTPYDFGSALGTYDPYFTYTYDGIPIAGPYPNITWQTGYSINNILGAGSSMSIDQNTGVVTAFPTQLGLFGFCVQVDEYRNGMRIGRNRFDVQYTVLTCNDAPIIANNVVCLNNSATIYTNTVPNGATYTWDLDGGTVVSGNGNGPGAFQVAWGTPGVKTLTLEVRDINNCKYGPSVKTVTVNPVPTANAGSSTTICQGANTQLNGTGSSVGVTFSWSPGGSISGQGTATPTATPFSSQNYTLTVTDANNCTAASTVSVTVANPTAAPAAQQHVDCYGALTGVAAANASSNISGSTFTYTWAPSGGNGAVASNLAGNVTYTLTIADQNNCTNTSQVTVTQPASDISTNTTGANLTCYNNNSGTVTANPSGGNGGAWTYAWQTNPVQSTATATGLGQGTYSVIVYDNKGCSKTGTYSITQPNAALDATVTTTNANCNGLLGSATAAATVGTGTPTYSYSWSNGAQTSVVNLAAGTYSVVVSDANNCTLTVQNVVITEPTALTTDTLVSDAHCGQPDGSATVIPNGGNPGTYTYSWAVGGNTNTINNVGVGVYQVTVTDPKGCAITTSAIVGNLLAPVLTYTVTSQNECYGTSLGSATANATGGTGGLSYTWVPSGGNGQTANGLAQGVYTITVTDGGGCVDVEQVTITQNPQLIVTPSSVDVVCKGENNGQASVLVSGGVQSYTYSWSNGLASASVNGLAPQTYSVTITDSKGCTNVQTITIAEPSAVLSSQITQSTNLNCNGINTGAAGVTATGGNTGAYTYSWSTNPVQNTSVASNLPSGIYTVLVTDSKNCSSISTVTLTQPNALTSSIAQPSEICEQNRANISVAPANGTAPYSYQWNGLGSNQSYNVSPSTTTTYTALVTDACGATSVSTVVVNVNPKPVADFGVNPTTSVLSDQTVTFTDSSLYATSWSWDFGDGSASTSQHPTHEYVASGSHTVTLIVTTPDGCSDTTYSVVDVKKEIKVPNVFTPWSKDGINDVFVITLSGVTEVQVVIYDRWGIKMFETTDPKNYWDGTSLQSGRPAPEGTYYFIVKATFGDGELVEEKGYLMLLK